VRAALGPGQRHRIAHPDTLNRQRDHPVGVALRHVGAGDANGDAFARQPDQRHRVVGFEAHQRLQTVRLKRTVDHAAGCFVW